MDQRRFPYAGRTIKDHELLVLSVRKAHQFLCRHALPRCREPSEVAQTEIVEVHQRPLGLFTQLVVTLRTHNRGLDATIQAVRVVATVGLFAHGLYRVHDPVRRSHRNLRHLGGLGDVVPGLACGKELLTLRGRYVGVALTFSH